MAVKAPTSIATLSAPEEQAQPKPVAPPAVQTVPQAPPAPAPTPVQPAITAPQAPLVDPYVASPPLAAPVTLTPEVPGGTVYSDPGSELSPGLMPTGPMVDPYVQTQPLLPGLTPEAPSPTPYGDYPGLATQPAPSLLEQIKSDPTGGVNYGYGTTSLNGPVDEGYAAEPLSGAQYGTPDSFGSIYSGGGDVTRNAPAYGSTAIVPPVDEVPSTYVNTPELSAPPSPSVRAPGLPLDTGGASLGEQPLLAPAVAATAQAAVGNGPVPAPGIPVAPYPFPSDVSAGGSLPPAPATLAPPAAPLLAAGVAGPTDTGGTAPVSAPRLALPAAPGAVRVNMQPFTAVDNLRGTQVSPSTGDALAKAQQDAARAATGVAGFSGLAPFRGINAEGDPRTADADAELALVRELLGKLSLGGPQSIAGTDLSRANGSLDGAQAALNGLGLRDPSPVSATDLSGAYGTLGDAEQAAQAARLGTGYERVAAGTYGPSAEANAARAAAAQMLGSLTGAPSRQDLALRSFNLLRDGTQEGYDRDLASATSRIAATGRIGNSADDSLSRLARSRASDMDRAREDLSLKAAQDELADRTSRLNSALGAFTTFGGEDRADTAAQLGLRNEARGERDYWTGLDQSRANTDLSRANALSTLANQRANFAGVRRADQESDRNFGLTYDQARAGLGLSKASALGALSDRYANLAGTTRRDAESDRAYNADYGQRSANLDLSRADATSRLSDTMFGRGQSLREEARGERDAATGQQLADLNARRGVLDSLSGVQAQQYGQDATTRGEYRTERDYQNTLAQQAIDNELRRAQVQDSLLGSAFGRDTDLTQLLMQLGYGGTNPASTLLGAAGQTQPDDSSLGDLAQYLAWRRAQTGGTSGPSGATSTAAFPTNWAY